MLRRHNPSLPVVLVGCQGDNKVGFRVVMVSECYTTPQDHATNTMLDTDTVLDTDNVVMHVETAAATSVKSVVVAFQVSALPALLGVTLNID